MSKLRKVVGLVVAVGLLLVSAAIALVLARYDRPHDVAMPPIAASTDPAVLRRGEYLVHGPAACGMCHTADGDVERAEGERPPMSGGFEFEIPGFGTFRPNNLTPDATGIGDHTPGELGRAIRHGVRRDGSLAPFMVVHANSMADDDLAATVSYLMSAEPQVVETGEDELGFMGKAMLAFALQPAAPSWMPEAPPMEPTVERGEYLAERVALCGFCHTQHDPVDMSDTTPRYSGGTPNPSIADPTIEFAAPNITPFDGGALARFSEDEFVERFAQGRIIPHSPMPWYAFANMSESDVRAVYRYLQTLDPVEKQTGPSVREVGWQQPS